MKFSFCLKKLLSQKVLVLLLISLLATGYFYQQQQKLKTASSTLTSKKSEGNYSMIVQRTKEKNSFAPSMPPPASAVMLSPKYPSPLNHLSDDELKSFPGGSVIEAADVDGPNPSQAVRVRILKTNFKYPYLRTEELFDRATGILLTREMMVADHLLVTLNNEKDASAFLISFGPEASKLERVTTSAPLYRLQLTSPPSLTTLPQALEQCQQEKERCNISEPDFIRQAFFSPAAPDDPYYSLQWELSRNVKNPSLLFPDGIDAPDAWKIRTSATSVIVAVVDTGIDYNHEDLAGNMWHNFAPTCGDIYGCDATVSTNECGYSGDPMDSLMPNNPSQGHGTMCAGIIGAVGDNGIGVTGIAWNVQLMACKFINNTGQGVDSDAIKCITYACDHGVKILNCSWGHSGESSAILLETIKYAQSKGVILVTAAGNDGNNNDVNPEYPANYELDNIVVVASTDPNDQLAHSSNYGPTTVHLAAPGVSIYSTSITQNDIFFHHPFYAMMSGTSMAAPHVVGALALMMAQFPKLSYQQIIAKLLAATDPIPALTGKTVAGRLNIARALAPL